MAQLYFVGNGTNWSSTSSWSTSSGGASGAAVPTASDDVVLDSNSPGNLTIDIAAACRSIVCTGFVYTLNHSTGITLSIGTSTTNGSTALIFSSGMTYTLGSATTSAISFVSTSTTQVQITSASKALGNVTFSGTGGSWLLVDGFSTGSTATVTLTTGTLNTNNQVCSWGLFASNNNNVRTLSVGSSNITLTSTGSYAWNSSSVGNFTVSSNTATISSTSSANSSNWFSSATLNFNGLSLLLNIGTGYIGFATSGTLTFANLTISGGAYRTSTAILPAQINVTGTFTATGNSTANRLLVQSATTGTQATINSASTSLSYVDFVDIKGAGSASWMGTSLGDCQGNTGITFDAEVDQTWSGNTAGNWSDSTKWTSRVPLPQDNVSIPALTSATITVDMPRLGKTVTTTGSTGGTITASSLSYATFYGSLILSSGVTLTGPASTLTAAGRSTYSISPNSASFSPTFAISAPGGTYSLLSDLTCYTFNLTQGSFNDGGHNMIMKSTLNISGTSTRALTMSGTWNICTIYNSGWVATTVTGLTFNAAGSNIVMNSAASSFVGGGLTYNNVTIAGGASANTLTVSGNNSFNILNIGAPRSVVFTSGSNNTMSNFIAIGSSGSLITITASTASMPATLTKANGTVSCNWLSLKDSTVNGGAAWYAGANSTNVSDNTGWIFASPTLLPGFFGLF